MEGVIFPEGPFLKRSGQPLGLAAVAAGSG